MHTMFDKESHGKTIDALTAEFETDSERGLSAAEARRRLDSGGYNELKDRPRPGFMALLWDQFNNFLIIILIVAALISLALGE